jgi:hypothetical protein
MWAVCDAHKTVWTRVAIYFFIHAENAQLMEGCSTTCINVIHLPEEEQKRFAEA